MRWSMALGLAIATSSVRLAAQPCPPPPELAGWVRPIPLVAMTVERDKPVAELVAGRAAVMTLASTDQVTFSGVAGHAGGPIRYAGLAMLTVRLPGTYRIALGGPAWIDVVAGGRAIEPTAHGHAPECSSVRKMVDFRLAAGRYLVQLSDARNPSLQAMVVRLGS